MVLVMVTVPRGGYLFKLDASLITHKLSIVKAHPRGAVNHHQHHDHDNTLYITTPLLTKEFPRGSSLQKGLQALPRKCLSPTKQTPNKII